MIFKLIEGIDVQAIEEKITNYQQENAEQIMINQARKAEDLAAAMAASKGIPVQADTDGLEQCLAVSLSSKVVVVNFLTSFVQSSQAGFVAGTQGQYAPTVAGGQPRPTGMAPQPVPLAGGLDMHGYALDDEEMMRLRAERGGRAGGWSIELSKKRALEEAFASIWI
ncbi:hypothetical protein Gohar_004465 [Gossypium harknessii]|uniref:MAT1 centre domain-containing protein n=1 Tax=Gossypium harknessii TaxID=34285 RepID=A0A7J9H4X6_9ROSI|nr:hypothetical protein [Gossypium harknessii]